MKKVVIYCPYPFDEAPSQRFRFEQYLPSLKENEMEVEILPFLDSTDWRVIYQPGSYVKKIKTMAWAWFRRWKSLRKAKASDFVFIHREMAQFGPPIFEWMLRFIYRKPFIYDFDDAIWLPNFSENNKWVHRVKWYGKVKHICKWADQITVGNAYLHRFASGFNENVQVIPTTIDLEHQHSLQPDYDKERLVLGWTGTHSTLHYLVDLIPVLQRLENEFVFEFHIISNQAPDFQLKSMVFVPWTKETEFTDLSQFSIGVMPLLDDKWAQGKCGFKALQYMALGIPCVISAVGVNKEIVQHAENGFLYQNSEEAYSYLKNLLENPDLRKQIGQNGRVTIEEKYSVRANTSNYLNLFQ